MEKHTICFNGRNPGHISKNWPGNSSTINSKKRKKPSFSSSSREITFTQNYPPTYCRCGGGFCIIKLILKKNQHFYSCPNKYELHCGYFKWCHKLKKEEILTQRQPLYPCCSCGAGICRLETERQKPFIGRKYFACRILKGQGACNFRQWQDDYYNPTPGMLEDTTAYDNRIANEIDMIRTEIENGEMDADFPCSTEEALVDETYSGDNTHRSPLPSPNSPLDVQALGSMDSRHLVVQWWY